METSGQIMSERQNRNSQSQKNIEIKMMKPFRKQIKENQLLFLITRNQVSKKSKQFKAIQKQCRNYVSKTFLQEHPHMFNTAFSKREIFFEHFIRSTKSSDQLLIHA